LLAENKFLIVITDGADHMGVQRKRRDDDVENPGMYKRRLLTVQRAKELKDAGFKVFMVGFGGTMPENLKRTLNWAAKIRRYG